MSLSCRKPLQWAVAMTVAPTLVAQVAKANAADTANMDAAQRAKELVLAVADLDICRATAYA